MRTQEEFRDSSKQATKLVSKSSTVKQRLQRIGSSSKPLVDVGSESESTKHHRNCAMAVVSGTNEKKFSVASLNATFLSDLRGEALDETFMQA